MSQFDTNIVNIFIADTDMVTIYHCVIIYVNVLL